MKTLRCLILVILMSGTMFGYSQEASNVNASDKITEGNKLLGEGKFGTALVAWLKIVKEDAENANANFKLGLCYRSSVDKQTKALLYFRKASKNITGKYNFYDIREKKAPYEALYFLGETYLTAGEPDSALLAFMQYKDIYHGTPSINVDNKIRLTNSVCQSSLGSNEVIYALNFSWRSKNAGY